jgi:hypothetical protein
MILPSGYKPGLAMSSQEANDPIMAYVLLVVLVVGISFGVVGLARNWRKRPWSVRVVRGAVALFGLFIGLIIDLLILRVL